MDTLDLMEIRKKLHSYKKTGKKNIMNILKQLNETSITIRYFRNYYLKLIE